MLFSDLVPGFLNANCVKPRALRAPRRKRDVVLVEEWG
jgi:hypothetical protein